MKTTKFEYVQKRTKRVVVIHDVPVKRVLEDGQNLFSSATALRLDKLLDDALAVSSQRVELWFSLKDIRPKKVA